MRYNVNMIITAIETLFFVFISYYTNYKISHKIIKFDKKFLIDNILIIFVTILYRVIKTEVDKFTGIISLLIMISLIFSIDNMSKSLLTTIVSLSINYIISILSIVLCFILDKILDINNDCVNLFIIIVLHLAILINLFKMKKFKYGFSFCRMDSKNEHMDILILNISSIVLFSIIIISNNDFKLATSFVVVFTVFAFIMFAIIQKSLQLYYKQKLLAQELDKTKEELANKTKEVEELEKENISISKKAHTLSHKQKSLEHRIEEMMMKAEISKEEVGELEDRLKVIGKDLYKEKTTTELAKTEIKEIDDMLKYMQSECSANKIDFELQIKGNIHYMTNNLISKDDLETLLADHIKNAIIAINHADNINRSILVRLGEIDGMYGLYIYDSGIEFEKETLENLGKKPSTTHAHEGGTGMGFMNTFDTLRKCKATLIIEEFNEPNKDNYTKAIMIKFDNKNEFNLNSYRYKR